MCTRKQHFGYIFLERVPEMLFSGTYSECGVSSNRCKMQARTIIAQYVKEMRRKYKHIHRLSSQRKQVWNYA